MERDVLSKWGDGECVQCAGTESDVLSKGGVSE